MQNNYVMPKAKTIGELTRYVVDIQTTVDRLGELVKGRDETTAATLTKAVELLKDYGRIVADTPLNLQEKKEEKGE